jgi:hypothetical protein
MKTLSIEVQEEIMNILESKNSEEFIKSSKIKQARIIIELRQKYDFKKKSLGMN